METLGRLSLFSCHMECTLRMSSCVWAKNSLHIIEDAERLNGFLDLDMFRKWMEIL